MILEKSLQPEDKNSFGIINVKVQSSNDKQKEDLNLTFGFWISFDIFNLNFEIHVNPSRHFKLFTLSC